MIIETIAWITQHLMIFFIPEVLFLLFVEKSGDRLKFRFSNIEGHPGLKPFANTWAVGIVAFIIYLVSPLIFEFFLGTAINHWLVNLDLLKLLALTSALGGFTLIFIVNYLFNKKRDKNTDRLVALIIIAFIIFII